MPPQLFPIQRLDMPRLHRCLQPQLRDEISGSTLPAASSSQTTVSSASSPTTETGLINRDLEQRKESGSHLHRRLDSPSSPVTEPC